MRRRRGGVPPLPRAPSPPFPFKVKALLNSYRNRNCGLLRRGRKIYIYQPTGGPSPGPPSLTRKLYFQVPEMSSLISSFSENISSYFQTQYKIFIYKKLNTPTQL